MKHDRRPTRAQKLTITAANLKPEEWLVIKNLHNQLHIVHRKDGTEKVIRVA